MSFKNNRYRFVVFLFLTLIAGIFGVTGNAFAGPGGSGNNFFFKSPTAFGTAPAGKFITFQGLTYQSFGSVFTNSGSVKHNGFNTAKFVFLPEFIWTRKILGVTNFFEVVTPVGSVSRNITEINQPASQPSNFSNSSGGIGDILLFYGIFSKKFEYKNVSVDFFPQVSITIPTGQWSSDSTVNIGGNQWQIMPALTGQVSYLLPDNRSLALDYAAGYSKNEGSSTVNVTGSSSITDPGDNIFLDLYLNFFATGKLDIYNETALVKQFDNYGYDNLNYGMNQAYGLINNGFKDVVSGFGADYHFTRSFQIDGRVLKDLHGDNGPDGFYGMVDIVMAF